MIKRTKAKSHVSYAVLFLLLLSANGCDHISEQAIAFPAPVGKVEFHSYAVIEGITKPTQRIGIHVASRDEVKQLVDLEVFGKLKPEMTVDAVVAQFGRPSETRGDDFGGTWSKYSTDFGYVEIGLDRQTSDEKESIAGRRSLRAYPVSGRPVLLSPLLEVLRTAEKITPRADAREIVIYDVEQDLLMQILLRNDHVDRVELFRHEAK